MMKNIPQEIKDIFGNPCEWIDVECIPCSEISSAEHLCTHPLVSVHVLTYNHASYIAETLESVLQQKCNFEFEILIGEDCSTDGTREICMNYQRRYPEKIRLFTSENNVGAKRNGMRMRKHIRGKYLTFCEGDDYWCDPEKLQKQVDYLETHPDCGLVCTNYDRYYQDAGQWRRNMLPTDLPIRQNHQEQAGELFIRDVFCVTCSVCCRTSLAVQLWQADPVVYQSTRFRMGDFPLFYEIAHQCAIYYMPESTAVYRIIGESASHSTNLNHRKAFARSMLDITVYCIEKHPIPAVYANEVARRSVYLMVVDGFFGDTFWAGVWPALRRIYPYGHGLEFWKRLAYLFSWFLLPFLRPWIRKTLHGLGKD